MGYRESIKTPVNSPESRRLFQCSPSRVPDSCRILPRRQVAVFRGTLQQANAEDIVQKMKPRTSLMKPNFSEEKRTSRSRQDHTSSQTSTKDEIMRGTTAVCDKTERNGYKQTVKNNVDASRKSASTSATRSLKTEHVTRQSQRISSPTTHRQAPSSHHGKHRGKTLSTTRSAPAAGRSSWRTQLPQLFLLYERQLCVSYRPSAVPPPVPEPVVPVVPSNSSSSTRRMRRYSTGRRMSVASTTTCSAFDQSIRPRDAHGKPRQQRPKARRLSLHSADGKKDADRGNMGTWAVRRFLRRSLPDEILEDHEAQDEAMLEKLPFVTSLQDFPRPSKKPTRRNSVVLNAYAATVWQQRHTKAARRLSLHSADGKKDSDRGNMGTWAVRRFLRRSLPDEILEDHEAQDEAMLEKLPFVTSLQDFPRPSKKPTRRNSVVLNAYSSSAEVKLQK
ncbi:snRNA transcription by RNA polymerase III [Branchiostoma belcheri]|nr:snRNA transcription by RNA polymerase III [Branchiostoma belcheri]